MRSGHTLSPKRAAPARGLEAGAAVSSPMQASLLTLIHRVDDFQKNLLVNVDRAIAGTAPLLLTKK